MSRQELTLALGVGLLAGWALNPMSWIGRSYVGQAVVDPGPASVALDAAAWALASFAFSVVVAHRGRIRARPQNGQSSLEVVGVVTIAAILVGAITLAVVQSSPQVTSVVKSKICEITTLGQGSCAVDENVRMPQDYVPAEDCVVRSRGNESDASASLVVTLSDGETWLIEDLGGGKSRLTRTTSGGLGISGGVGFDVTVKVDGVKYGAALTASAQAIYKARQGDVYHAGTNAEAEEVLDQKRTDDTKDFWVGDQGNPVRDAWDWAFGEGEHEDASPDEWFDEAGFDAIGYGGGTGLYSTAGAEATAEAHLGTRHKNDATSTDYFRASASVTASADAWDGGDQTYVAAAKAGMESMVEIDRDQDGNPMAMRLTSATMTDTRAGTKSPRDRDPSYTERTIQIPLTSPADKALASRVLWATGMPFMPGVTDGVTQPGEVASPFQINEVGRDLARVASEQGYIYQRDYTQDVSENGFNFDAEAIAKLGVSGTSNNIRSEMTDYKYWNGSQMVDREGCTA